MRIRHRRRHTDCTVGNRLLIDSADSSMVSRTVDITMEPVLKRVRHGLADAVTDELRATLAG